VKRLVLIRHGETIWNAEHRFTTHSDVPLSEAGIEQARSLADALRTLGIDRIHTSPMQRTRRTADIVAEAQEGDCPVLADARLVEISAGPFDGHTTEELLAGPMAEEFSRWHTDEEPEFPAGTETFDAALARVDSFFADHDGEPGVTVIVTHGSLARLIISSHLLGGPPSYHRRLWIDNGRLTMFEERDRVMKMVAFNAVALS
jgi:glucosyl-3-phosphoglycerate phosphatase